MKTIVLCAKCKQELFIVDVEAAWTIHEVEISVEICQNPDCYEGEESKPDCSHCMDLKLWQKRAEEAEAKLKYLKELLNENKPAQLDEKEPSGVNVLEPTEDIVSTGGAIIPGVKKGFAKGVQADY